MITRLQITVGDTVLFALALDDWAIVAERELEVFSIPGRQRNAIKGSIESIALVLDDILDRSVTGNWDQPASWTRACAKAWPRLKAEVEMQGFDVKVTGHLRTVSLHPRLDPDKELAEWNAQPSYEKRHNG